MKLFIKILLLVTILSKMIFACTLCSTQIPTIIAIVEKNQTEKNTTFNIKWTFDKEFSKKTIDTYPKRYDIKFKLQEIKKALEQYTSENNYLTFISYDANQTYNIDKISNSKFELKRDRFIYTYSIIVDTSKFKSNNIDIKFKDNGNYFAFHFNEDNIIDKSENKQNKFIEYLSKTLQSITDDIKNLLNDIDKSNSIIAYFWLLAFSFLYGVVHAVGPGHGKSLISSYFLKDESSHIKALSMSGLIGVVHTFSAFTLTFVIYTGVNTIFGSYFKNIETIATKISAVIIIFIALYLIYKKIIQVKHKHSCGCSGCKTHSTDLGVVLAAGIVPCAGTVTIFIYTMSLNLYFIGFLSAVFMSLGMSFIIYITALLSIKIRDKSSSNTTLLRVFEYGSLVFILCLGLILFFA